MGSASRSAALDESRVEADVSDVVPVEQPGEEALQAQAVAAVGARAVLPLQHSSVFTSATFALNEGKLPPGEGCQQ